MSGFVLRHPKLTEVVRVAKWRNEARVGLRTSHLSTEDGQREFYDRIVVPGTKGRYYSVKTKTSGQRFVAFVGLYPIQWENGIAEISLVVNPAETNRGIGMASVDLVLEEAFGRLGLSTVYGECYHCNPARGFWTNVCVKYNASSVELPRRKLWDATLYGSDWFTITSDSWLTFIQDQAPSQSPE